MTNTQKIIDDAVYLRDMAEKLQSLLEHKILTKKEFDKCMERLCKPYK